jgi:O-antigen ligase
MATITKIRAWTREHYPFTGSYCVFLCLAVLLLQVQVRNFYLVFVLLPAALTMRWDEVIRLSRSWILRLSLALLVVLWLSLFWSGDTHEVEWPRFARHMSVNFSFVAVTAWLAWRSDRFEERLARWFASVIGAAALAWLIVFYVHGLSKRFVFSYFSNPNTGGIVLGVVCVIAVIAAASPSADKRWRYVHIATAMISLTGVVLSASRASLLALTVSLTVVLLLRRLWWLNVLALLPVALLTLITRGGWSELLERGDARRFEAWSYYWALAERRPFTGYGIGNEFAFTYPLKLVVIDNPHNLLLNFFLYGGLPSAIVFAALMVCLVVVGSRVTRCARRDMPFAISLYMIVVGMFEGILPIHLADWQWIYFWLPIGTLAGAELALSGAARPRHTPPRSRFKTSLEAGPAVIGVQLEGELRHQRGAEFPQLSIARRIASGTSWFLASKNYNSRHDFLEPSRSLRIQHSISR